MKKIIILIAFTIYCSSTNAKDAADVEIFELHNKQLDSDPGLQKSINLSKLENKSQNSDEEEINEENIQIEDDLIFSEDGVSTELTGDSLVSNTDSNIDFVPSFWELANKDNLIYLFDNIEEVNSPAIKSELMYLLDINSSPPNNFQREDFENIIINNLIKFKYKDKAYKSIKSLYDIQNQNYIQEYKKFELSYLLSTYKISEACDLRNSFEKFKNIAENNFLLKIDIFCLLLQEKFDEANLLNSLLLESTDNQDYYFQYLFNKLNNISVDELLITNLKLLDNEIFLYSAMHRLGNIPLSQKFLDVDPINLSMPIILSNNSNINLRLEAAHIAYKNEILKSDSLAALYQFVDFSTEDLNNSQNFEKITKNNVELGMAYYFQLSNIQILPLTRLEAMISFWSFAEKNNLGPIAFELSLQSLETIEPSSEFSDYAIDIIKAYIKTNNFDKAKNWISFVDQSSIDESYELKFESSKFLIKMNNIEDNSKFIDALKFHLKDLQNNANNEILFSIFSIIDDNKDNLFELEKKLYDTRSMPSSYLIENIKNSIESKNFPELLLFVIISLNNKDWNNLHPEHLSLILNSLKVYKNGLLFNDIVIEILEINKII